MFDIGWSELLVIGIVALIVIGPKELPGVLRTLSQMMGKVRRMASEFQGQFQEAMREAEMADLKKQVDALNETARGVTDFDPMASVRREMENAIEERSKAAETSATSIATSAAPSVTTAAESVEPTIPLPEPVSPVVVHESGPPTEPLADAQAPAQAGSRPA
jgi:sec-independent protein translocase protein TatB